MQTTTLRHREMQEAHHLNIDEVMRELHILAIEFNVHIFLVAHPKQTVQSDQKIQPNELRGSAAIKQYADNILAIRRMNRCGNPNNPEVEVSILISRMFGVEGSFTLRYDGEQENYTNSRK